MSGKADISRSTFDRRRHYDGVRLQQGRVLLDAEWNEQVDIHTYLDETANTDVIGVSGAPRENGGFQLFAVPGDLIIAPGRMWVDGILCESDAGESIAASATTLITSLTLNVWPRDDSRLARGLWIQISGLGLMSAMSWFARIESTDEAQRTITFNPAVIGAAQIDSIRPVWSYATQPHDPNPPFTSVADGIRSLTVQSDFVAYLDVWKRQLTAVEEPSLREIALGGPDTGTRTQTIWRVRLDGTLQSCAGIRTPRPSSRLIAQTTAAPQSTSPCIIPSRAGFRGLGNQLYRVEVHKPSGDPGGPTFKWSRDNGAFVFSIEGPIAAQATQLRLYSLGRDDRFGLRADDWIELIDDVIELQGRPGIMARVLTTPQQSDRILSLDPATLPAGTDFNDPAKSAIDLTRGARVRLWSFDPINNGGNGEIAISTGSTATKLESGIEVLFSGTAFRTGEYWLIPARTSINDETGDIEWPRFDGQPLPQLPPGIAHHYAALADVTLTDPWTIEDCRPLFSPLTAPEFFYLSGDGQEVMPNLVTDARISLPFPLQVGVSNGGPIAHATVEFRIITGNGDLTGGVTTKNVETGANGIASINWRVDAGTPHQLCRATLLEANGYDTLSFPPIEFNASISVASQVAYDQAGCAELQRRGVRNVQTALDAMCDILDDPHLYFVGGDGQETLRSPGKPSPLPLQIEVGVANALTPLANQSVRFTPSDGGTIDAGAAGAAVTVSTSAAGIARVQWALDGKGPESQTAAATLLVNNNPVGLPVIFKASFREVGGSICTITIKEGDDVAAKFAEAPEKQPVEICFGTGTFPVPKPLVLREHPSVKITGAGAGTELTGGSTTVIDIRNCGSVVMRDLAMTGGSVETDPKDPQAALLFVSCGDVKVEGIYSSCAPHDKPGMHICLSAKDCLLVSVHRCRLIVSRYQFGVLVINPESAVLAENRINGIGGTKLLSTQPGSRGAGIAVLGARSQDSHLTIRDNDIRRTNTAIDVGTAQQTPGLIIDRTVIANNLISSDVFDEDDPVGIRVDSFESLLIEGNRLLFKKRPQSSVAIRVQGTPGPFAILRENDITLWGRAIDTSGATPPPAVRQWRLIGNLASDCISAWTAPDFIREWNVPA